MDLNKEGRDKEQRRGDAGDEAMEGGFWNSITLKSVSKVLRKMDDSRTSSIACHKHFVGKFGRAKSLFGSCRQIYSSKLRVIRGQQYIVQSTAVKIGNYDYWIL